MMVRKLLMLGLLGLALAALAPMEPVGFNQSAEAQQLSRACQRVYSNYRAKRGPKAFAVTSGGGCGSYWGDSSLVGAQNGALNACRRKRSGCRLVGSLF
ncbi:MAG: hypothetical protein NTZ14_10000 [Hyphomicrobiales bacterium]|nr:hypothetical protein [Hyphomicrobiales bacterium]